MDYTRKMYNYINLCLGINSSRFYATGCYQRPGGEQWGLSMSQSSVSRCIRDVTNAINNTLLKQWV